MKNIHIPILVVLVNTFLFSCKKEPEPAQFTIYQSTGNIASKLEEFKAHLGNLNTMPGATSGRREINWDGVADSLLNKPLSDHFFNAVGENAPAARQRGLSYDGGEFEVSATNFSHINSEAATEFAAFSGNKSFANVSSNLWHLNFEVAGQAIPASTTAFGIVFIDVDIANSTSVEFFEGAKSIGKFFIPAHDNTSKFSFFGIQFHNKKITRVQIHHQGNLKEDEKDISQGGTKDLVVIDDLIYSEPLKWQE